MTASIEAEVRSFIKWIAWTEKEWSEVHLQLHSAISMFCGFKGDEEWKKHPFPMIVEIMNGRRQMVQGGQEEAEEGEQEEEGEQDDKDDNENNYDVAEDEEEGMPFARATNKKKQQQGRQFNEPYSWLWITKKFGLMEWKSCLGEALGVFWQDYKDVVYEAYFNRSLSFPSSSVASTAAALPYDFDQHVIGYMDRITYETMFSNKLWLTKIGARPQNLESYQRKMRDRFATTVLERAFENYTGHLYPAAPLLSVGTKRKRSLEEEGDNSMPKMTKAMEMVEKIKDRGSSLFFPFDNRDLDLFRSIKVRQWNDECCGRVAVSATFKKDVEQAWWQQRAAKFTKIMETATNGVVGAGSPVLLLSSAVWEAFSDIEKTMINAEQKFLEFQEGFVFLAQPEECQARLLEQVERMYRVNTKIYVSWFKESKKSVKTYYKTHLQIMEEELLRMCKIRDYKSDPNRLIDGVILMKAIETCKDLVVQRMQKLTADATSFREDYGKLLTAFCNCLVDQTEEMCKNRRLEGVEMKKQSSVHLEPMILRTNRAEMMLEQLLDHHLRQLFILDICQHIVHRLEGILTKLRFEHAMTKQHPIKDVLRLVRIRLKIKDCVANIARPEPQQEEQEEEEEDEDETDTDIDVDDNSSVDYSAITPDLQMKSLDQFLSQQTNVLRACEAAMQQEMAERMDKGKAQNERLLAKIREDRRLLIAGNTNVIATFCNKETPFEKKKNLEKKAAAAALDLTQEAEFTTFDLTTLLAISRVRHPSFDLMRDPNANRNFEQNIFFSRLLELPLPHTRQEALILEFQSWLAEKNADVDRRMDIVLSEKVNGNKDIEQSEPEQEQEQEQQEQQQEEQEKKEDENNIFKRFYSINYLENKRNKYKLQLCKEVLESLLLIHSDTPLLFCHLLLLVVLANTYEATETTTVTEKKK